MKSAVSILAFLKKKNYEMTTCFIQDGKKIKNKYKISQCCLYSGLFLKKDYEMTTCFIQDGKKIQNK